MRGGPRPRPGPWRRRGPVVGEFCPWPLPVGAASRLLELGRLGFVDDGCSCSPDGWRLAAGTGALVDLSWACRLHDAAYCQRVTPRQSPAARAWADAELRAGVAWSLRSALPVAGLLWALALPAAYWLAVRRFGRRSYGTCGTAPGGATDAQRAAGLCRHGQPMPG